MSLEIAHFAFGAGMMSLVVTLLVPSVQYPRSVVVAGGLWAMLPDVHWISPVAGAQLRSFHASTWADLFWLHRTLDGLDPTDSERFAAGLFAFFLVATVLAEWRSYRAPSPVQSVASREGES